MDDAMDLDGTCERGSARNRQAMGQSAENGLVNLEGTALYLHKAYGEKANILAWLGVIFGGILF